VSEPEKGGERRSELADVSPPWNGNDVISMGRLEIDVRFDDADLME